MLCIHSNKIPKTKSSDENYYWWNGSEPLSQICRQWTQEGIHDYIFILNRFIMYFLHSKKCVKDTIKIQQDSKVNFVDGLKSIRFSLSWKKTRKFKIEIDFFVLRFNEMGLSLIRDNRNPRISMEKDWIFWFEENRWNTINFMVKIIWWCQIILNVDKNHLHFNRVNIVCIFDFKCNDIVGYTTIEQRIFTIT